MTAGPPPYPRTPYLWPPGPVGADDIVLSSAEREVWLTAPVAVEEKLDGANVAIWWDDGRPEVATRGGPGAMDRARQLGPLRAWVGGALERVRAVCDGGWTLYGEWLWLRHSVSYDDLPEPLVALDLHRSDVGFADHAARRDRIVDAGLVPPPILFDGILGGPDALLALMGTSRFGREPMEGAVLRRGARDRCKVIRPDFVRAGDDNIALTRNGIRSAPTTSGAHGSTMEP